MRDAPIGSGTAQHLVDAQNVEGVDTDTHVEGVLARRLGNVFIGTDTGGFKGFGRKLFVFIRDEVATEGELVDGGTFATQVKDTDLINVSIFRRTKSRGFERTFGSGTPRLYRDLGYGLFLQ